MNEKIKKWYIENYPEDDFAKDAMKDKSTFQDLFDALENYKDVYKVLFQDYYGDSIIRERCFTKLAELIGKDYDYIYNQWLLGR